MKRDLDSSERADVAAHPDLMRGLMLSVVAFMARTGMSNKAIRDIFLECVSQPAGRRSKKRTARKPGISYGCDTIAGAVLRAWHKFPVYLDSAARPLSLRVDGQEPTITSLIISQDSRADVRSVIRSMCNAGLIRKTGANSYAPKKDAATIESLDPLAIDHIAKTVMRLVETASGNIDGTRDKLQLIERYAHVPDLSKSEAMAFAAFSRQQGQACLDAIEDWLEARQTNHAYRSKKSEKGINAGVHIFAYLGEGAARRRRSRTELTAKRAKPTPEARA